MKTRIRLLVRLVSRLIATYDRLRQEKGPAMILRVACVLVLLGTRPSISVASPPNIIMVFIDDLGWGDFSCFGNTEAKTPNIDRLAAEGIRFTQFYVNSPICSPSRCALTTGMYPQRWRITSFLNNRADNQRRGVANWLDPKAAALPGILQRHGYATGHFGKWHLGGQRDVADAPPISAYGFDETLTNFEGMGAKLLPLTLKPGDTEPGRIWADAERLGGPVVWMRRSEITGGFANAAAAFIRRAIAADKPFYINLWPDDVHGPWWPPTTKWGAGGKRSLYLSVLEEMDRQLGGLFNLVRGSPALSNNTLILLCSDNGHEPGVGSGGPLRGHKATLYEGGVRSPLIAWGPGLIVRDQAGSTNQESVLSAMDIVPSLLAVAGVVPASETMFDGENLSAALLGKNAMSRAAPLYWRRPPDRKSAYGAGPLPDLAVRDREWKLLCEFDGTKPELYRVAADPGEKTNLAAKHPEVVARLTQAVLAWNESMPQDESRALGSNDLAPKTFRTNRKTRRP